MRKHLNINVADLIATLILAAAAALIGYDLGHHGYVHDVYESGYADGYDDGFKEGSEDQGLKWSDAIVEWCYTGEAWGDICEDRW